VNKRDLDNALPVRQLQELLRWPGATSYVESVATSGVGVDDALKALLVSIGG
jgi:signal recognition particle receptor subunit beta